MAQELWQRSALELRNELSDGSVKPSEVVGAYLQRIEKGNPSLSAFTYVDPQKAMDKAEDQDKEAPPSRLAKPLWGLPLGDKDLNDRAGVPTTFGSRAFAGYVPDVSSPITVDLDEAGGVFVGKTNVPEFGFPPYSKNTLDSGYAKNPWDPILDPGGSSSGAATAVAARMLPLAPGNDAGGSVRIPALATGLVGLKPSRGRVPGESGFQAPGGMPVGGPIARTIEDTALLFDAMVAGPYRFASRAPSPGSGKIPALPETGSYLDGLAEPVRPLKIGWTTWSAWSTHYEAQVDPQAMRVFESAKKLATTFGHQVDEVPTKVYPTFVDAFREVWMATAAGLPVPEDAMDAVEPLTSWLIETGRKRPAGNLPRALADLAAFEAEIIEDFSEYDVVLTPGLALTPRPFDWFDDEDGEASFAQQTQFTPFTAVANVAGLPAIALPTGVGTSEITGATVPLGVQFMGRPGDELTLLRLGMQYQDALEWQDRLPPLGIDSLS